MKSRATTYLLLVLAACVWALVGWKILSPASNDNRPTPTQPVASQPPVREPDTLRLDYTDPFLKGISDFHPNAVIRDLSSAKFPKPQREKIEIIHWGTIASNRCKLYILHIRNEQVEARIGETAAGFTLRHCDTDSLYLLKDGIIYGVKLCE